MKVEQLIDHRLFILKRTEPKAGMKIVKTKENVTLKEKNPSLAKTFSKVLRKLVLELI